MDGTAPRYGKGVRTVQDNSYKFEDILRYWFGLDGFLIPSGPVSFVINEIIRYM